MAVTNTNPTSSVMLDQPLVSGDRQYHNTDEPYTLPSSKDEIEDWRLNVQHYGIKDYFGGNNCGAAWPVHPKKILEIGSGNGVWAREVCEQFPEAEVVGVDMIDGVKNKPSNLTFQLLNFVKDAWPFAPGSFDIVHCRFVAMHIPNFEKLLDKAIEATAPGGILMFEDQDQELRAEGKPVPHPAHLGFAIFHGFCDTVNVNPRPGPLFAPLIMASRQFAETHETVVPAPVAAWSEDKKLHAIGESIRHGITGSARGLNEKLFQYGMTKDIVEGMIKEIENPKNKLYMDQYFVWARKKRSCL
ncbi:S-adenosyl-L-methionine-dependent methyltransferase [Dacryopinax primogenitus]|uniref:S-adenosyl-L-methionine-dependent methyltransferase n=1 Tax=Dacryopinax primogenitus (strain DJM 731) TaxID=1858805 RepID=M5GFA8_DACPD|nr:S-adenosyl-L-methionine-dependent methyltransferase [Dacryopinax primogenitus]EJU03998.1 S-adenosyl-L-methionine-dependent methyltransferase [Dacryopinax primogenitus]